MDWSTVDQEVFDFVRTFDEPLTKTVPFVVDAHDELSNKVGQKYDRGTTMHVRKYIEKYELSHYSGYAPNPELLNFIRKNTHTYTYYMWTCNTTFVAETVLKNERLFPLFEKIVTQTDVVLIKPEPEGFYTFYNTDEPLSSYLMIGDSLADENAAKAAGIDFFRIDYFSR
ncbi:MAG: HAD hydrolase-like protein [Candidatus Roizmanbacteria bacterium]|nr:HAD hydrolase-like protein [Candidatus Roizmanbacteria bacterium]